MDASDNCGYSYLKSEGTDVVYNCNTCSANFQNSIVKNPKKINGFHCFPLTALVVFICGVVFSISHAIVQGEEAAIIEYMAEVNIWISRYNGVSLSISI